MSDRALDIARAGLQSLDAQVEALMQNLVNAETPGYRKTNVVVRAFPLELEAAESRLAERESVSLMRPVVEGLQEDRRTGHLLRTGQPLDLAMEGAGSFALQGASGEVRTRDGRFQVDGEGRVIHTIQKLPLLGEQGPLWVTPQANITVARNGMLSADGAPVDRIRIDPADATSGVIQGFLEMPATRVVDITRDLLMLSRIYSLDARLIQVRDQMLGRSMELPRAQ